jgi:hypothetical protein
MFLGQHCYPLTPRAQDSKPHDQDQLNCILNKIGELSENDKSFISNEDARTYVSIQKIEKHH